MSDYATGTCQDVGSGGSCSTGLTKRCDSVSDCALGKVCCWQNGRGVGGFACVDEGTCATDKLSYGQAAICSANTDCQAFSLNCSTMPTDDYRYQQVKDLPICW
jgi:hypothetical protein